MSRTKKKRYQDQWASLDAKDQYFGTIYPGMLQHKNYKALSIGAKQFYTLCRVQAMSSNGKACLYNHAKEYGTTYGENAFCFPASHLESYGIQRSNSKKYFTELIARGFVDEIENNYLRKKINIYAFSDRWKSL